jgi:hypothetical protein
MPVGGKGSKAGAATQPLCQNVLVVARTMKEPENRAEIASCCVGAWCSGQYARNRFVHAAQKCAAEPAAVIFALPK